jgi:anti-sigma B factor antagonist
MALTVQTLDDVAVVVLEVEELDAGNTPGFKGEIAPVLEANTRVVLDLSKVRFVDSSGLGFFISCLRKLMARGGDLKLCGMTKQVRAVFELVTMHRILEIHKTREEAVRAFQRDTSTTLAREATT